MRDRYTVAGTGAEAASIHRLSVAKLTVVPDGIEETSNQYKPVRKRDAAEDCRRFSSVLPVPTPVPML
jgi:hypothetical protein